MVPQTWLLNATNPHQTRALLLLKSTSCSSGGMSLTSGCNFIRCDSCRQDPFVLFIDLSGCKALTSTCGLICLLYGFPCRFVSLQSPLIFYFPVYVPAAPEPGDRAGTAEENGTRDKCQIHRGHAASGRPYSETEISGGRGQAQVLRPGGACSHSA